MVQHVWKEKIRSRDPWGVLKAKITKSQHACKQWKRVRANPIDHLILQKTLQLGALRGEGEESDMELINQLQGEVSELIEMEELKWQQRANQAWLQHGDKNSKYYHACVNQRRKSNLIKQIQDMLGVSCTEQGAIEDAFLRYYVELFQSNWLDGLERCLSGIPCRVMLEMNEKLLKPCTTEEVDLALQHMGSFKPPSLDGFSASFYQQNWGTLG